MSTTRRLTKRAVLPANGSEVLLRFLRFVVGTVLVSIILVCAYRLALQHNSSAYVISAFLFVGLILAIFALAGIVPSEIEIKFGAFELEMRQAPASGVARRTAEDPAKQQNAG